MAPTSTTTAAKNRTQQKQQQQNHKTTIAQKQHQKHHQSSNYNTIPAYWLVPCPWPLHLDFNYHFLCATFIGPDPQQQTMMPEFPEWIWTEENMFFWTLILEIHICIFVDAPFALFI
jgi:hypothetical protein